MSNQQTDFNPTEWITTKEAAELTGYTPSYLRKAISRDRLQGLKRGGAWFMRKEEVLAYVEKMRRLGPAKHDPWRSGGRTKDSGAG
jgi:excisionase family DNA binding protein